MDLNELKKIFDSWKNQDEVYRDNKYFYIDPLEPQKRLRVWQKMQDDILEALKPSNYLTEFVRYMKGCDNLSRCFPNHQELGHIDELRIEFWAKYQKKVKLEILPMIKKIKKSQVKKDLDMMRF